MAGEITAEPASFFVIESIRIATHYGPCSFVDGHERSYVDFRWSSHVAPRWLPVPQPCNADDLIWFQAEML
jgi:hypothetical protein